MEQNLASTPRECQPRVRVDSLGRPMPQRDAFGRFIRSNAQGEASSQANLVAMASRLDEPPKNYEQAKQRTDWPQWQSAMEEEMASLIKNEVFEVVPIEQATSKLIESRWVLTKKYNSDGSMNKYKC